MSLCVQCPAGHKIGSVQQRPLGCHCAVEGTIILEPEGSASLAQWCYDRYTDCPSWRAEKEAVWAGDHNALLASDRKKDAEVSITQQQVALAQRRRMQAFEAGEDHIARKTIGEMISWSRDQGA